MSRTTSKLGRKSKWKARDRAYREQERERRAANRARRAEVAAAAEAGLPVDVWRARQAEEGEQ
jgi:hypothetical protein